MREDLFVHSVQCELTIILKNVIVTSELIFTIENLLIVVLFLVVPFSLGVLCFV